MNDFLDGLSDFYLILISTKSSIFVPQFQKPSKNFKSSKNALYTPTSINFLTIPLPSYKHKDYRT